LAAAQEGVENSWMELVTEVWRSVSFRWTDG
jgi:hypothetical protein